MADYSTTIGVFQSQVGKSGDILLKFEHKNGGERGIRTLERENPLTIFETVAFGHSAISPLECSAYGFIPYSINIMHVCCFGNTEVKKN